MIVGGGKIAYYLAKMLLDDRITPLFPYKRPMTKQGFFRKTEYAYDEYYDCYICPEIIILEQWGIDSYFTVIPEKLSCQRY